MQVLEKLSKLYKGLRSYYNSIEYFRYDVWIFLWLQPSLDVDTYRYYSWPSVSCPVMLSGLPCPWPWRRWPILPKLIHNSKYVIFSLSPSFPLSLICAQILCDRNQYFCCFFNWQEFHWDQSTKDTILSSFFWGYICTQVLGNIIAQRWGAQKVLSGALAFNGLLTLSVYPAAHYGGWEYVCITRIIAGFAQGTIMPTLHTLLSKWSPSEERGRLGQS